jgi:hypothetical protein
MFCLQTVIKEDLPKRAKTLSSDSEELLNEAKMTQKRLQQGIKRGRWQGHSGALINLWTRDPMQKWVLRSTVNAFTQYSNEPYQPCLNVTQPLHR